MGAAAPETSLIDRIIGRRFRYDVPGRWLKGGTHLHTTASDGGLTPPELAARYAAAGYDFLCCTDHWVPSSRESLPRGGPLLWIAGVELDGHDARGSFYHVVCLGDVVGVDERMGLEAGLAAARAQGALTILAHPHWSGNSQADALAQPFDGVEVYNHQCRWLNGKSDGAVHWHAMLGARPDTAGLAVDDAHLTPDHPWWNGGWIVVRAPDLSAPAVLGAIRAGTFYASCGPRLDRLTFDGTSVHLACSPVAVVRLVGPGRCGVRYFARGGGLVKEAALPVPPDWAYVVLEIEDEGGRRAWTSTLFTGAGIGSAGRPVPEPPAAW
ncbi:MAG TPA: hypothetical protein VGQ83_18255 [Polyangia bacterium]